MNINFGIANKRGSFCCFRLFKFINEIIVINIVLNSFTRDKNFGLDTVNYKLCEILLTITQKRNSYNRS